MDMLELPMIFARWKTSAHHDDLSEKGYADAGL